MTAQTLALLEWIAREQRAYPETVEVWRTTCPHHAVWEDALDDDLVAVERRDRTAYVGLTARGRELLGDR